MLYVNAGLSAGAFVGFLPLYVSRSLSRHTCWGNSYLLALLRSVLMLLLLLPHTQPAASPLSRTCRSCCASAAADTADATALVSPCLPEQLKDMQKEVFILLRGCC